MLEENEDGYYVTTGLEKSLDFQCLDDKYFQFDFEEEIESIPVEIKIEYKNLKGQQKNINTHLVKAEYIHKKSYKSFGKYRCKYERFLKE